MNQCFAGKTGESVPTLPIKRTLPIFRPDGPTYRRGHGMSEGDSIPIRNLLALNMLRHSVVLGCLLCCGCSLLPAISHQPTLHNPFPQPGADPGRPAGGRRVLRRVAAGARVRGHSRRPDRKTDRTAPDPSPEQGGRAAVGTDPRGRRRRDWRRDRLFAVLSAAGALV